MEAVAAAAQSMRTQLDVIQQLPRDAAWQRRTGLLLATWPLARFLLLSMGGPAPHRIWLALMEEMSDVQVSSLQACCQCERQI